MGKQKGPPLTKEELIARKRAKKLLAKQKKEEKLRQIKRDQLERELEYCRLNREKYEKGWRKTLLDFKLKDLHNDYQYHVNYSERILDAKDMEISLLLDELDIAEEQYTFNLQKYILNFDIIIDSLDLTLNQLKVEYDTDLAELKQLAETERNHQNEIDSKRENNLQLVIFGLGKNQKAILNEMKSRYLSRIKEEEDLSMAEIELTQATLERRFESLWRDFKDTINEYKRVNGETKMAYELLHTQDAFRRKWIRKQTRELFRDYDKIYQLRFEQSQEKDSIDLQLKAKMEEHQFFANGFHTLKQQLIEDVNKDEEQSKNVVKYCYKSVKKLESLSVKGEHILKINAICRKFETDKELIMPYPDILPLDTIPIHLSKQAPANEQLKLYKEKRMLDLLFQRYYQGDALRNVLYEEYQYYINTNMLLKRQIFGHCISPDYSCTNIKKKKNGEEVICVKKIY